MPPKPAAKIIDIRDVPSTDPVRVGKLDTVITYQVDAFRTYSMIMPKEEATTEAIRAKIKAEMAERMKIIGTEVELGP